MTDIDDLPDASPVSDVCSLCEGTGQAPCSQCGGSGDCGEWDEQRLAENAELRRAIEAAVEKLRRVVATSLDTEASYRCHNIANDLERAIGVPW